MLSRLDDDSLLEIFFYLDLFDALSFYRTCSRVYKCGEQNRTLWKDLAVRYSCVGDFKQLRDVELKSAEALKRSVLRTSFLYSNLQKDKPTVHRSTELQGRSIDPSEALRVYFSASEEFDFVGRYIIAWNTSQNDENVIALDLKHSQRPTYEVNRDPSLHHLGRRMRASRDSNETLLLFWKGNHMDPRGSIIIKRLSVPGLGSSLDIESSVTTITTVPIPCNIKRLGDSSIDIVRERFAISFLFPPRVYDYAELPVLVWGLLIIFDWKTKSGVLIDTGLKFFYTGTLTLPATRVVLTEDGQHLIIWVCGKDRTEAKMYKIARLETMQEMIDIESFENIRAEEDNGEPFEEDSSEFLTEESLVFPHCEIRKTDVYFSGPTYDDCPTGETTCFTLYGRGRRDRKFGQFIATHYYAKGVYPSTDSLYFMTISSPGDQRRQPKGPLFAVDCHHMCWIEYIRSHRGISAVFRKPERRMFLVRLPEMHAQNNRREPMVIEAPEDVVNDAVGLWLRMDVASIVVRTRGGELHWIKLA